MLALKILGFVLLGLLVLLLLLLVVPVRVRVRYTEALAVTLWVLCVPIRLSPKAEKESPQKSTADKPKPKAETKPKKEKEKKPNKIKARFEHQAKELKEHGLAAAVAWLKEVVAALLKAAGRLLSAITVTDLTAFADIASEDAAQTALTYGKVCGVVYPALGVVEGKLKVKRQEVRITPAFCAEETRFGFDVRLKISVWRVLFAALTLLISYIQLPAVGEKKCKQDSKKEAAF